MIGISDTFTNIIRYRNNSIMSYFANLVMSNKQSDVLRYIKTHPNVNLNERVVGTHTLLTYCLIQDEEFAGMVKILCDAGADVNSITGNGCTPLMLTNTETMLILLNAGADVNFKLDNGTTLLMYTIANWDADIEYVKVWLKYGLDVTSADNMGRTALHYCGENTSLHYSPDYLEFIQLLLSNGACVHVTDNNGNTPLMTIVKNSPSNSTTYAIIKLLVDAGADVHTENDNGVSLMMIVCQRLVKMELHKNMYAKKIVGTACTRLRHQKMYDIGFDVFLLLMSHKCSIVAVDCNGKSVLNYATEGTNSSDIGRVVTSLLHHKL